MAFVYGLSAKQAEALMWHTAVVDTAIDID
jgi:hypothetical protein